MPKKILLISLLSFSLAAKAQKVSAVYSVAQLLSRIEAKDTLYVVNFWATWCKPCVAELPALDSLHLNPGQGNLKVLLVCLDFKEELESKVNPFLQKKNIQSECVLLDEVNGNAYINKISKDWSGAIPASLFKAGEKKLLIEKKMRLSELRENIKAMQ